MIAPSAIGLLGGTFDPIHFGHLRLAEEVADTFQLRQVRLIPASIPPHRAQPAASATHRLAMANLAIAGNARLAVDPREIGRAGASYTIDTLGEIRTESGDQPVCLLMGADAFVLLSTWHRWEALFELAHIIIARRPGYPLEDLASTLPRPLREHYDRRLRTDRQVVTSCPAGLLFTHELTALDVSATKVRELIRSNASLRYLLPEAVIAYIENEQLYREPDAD